MNKPLPSIVLKKMQAYWRAANYLFVGHIYLRENPLLKEPLTLQHVNARDLGNWSTTPGLNFIYVHLDRVINQHGLNGMFVSGSGRSGPFLMANTYLAGSHSDLHCKPYREGPLLQRRAIVHHRVVGGHHVIRHSCRLSAGWRRTQAIRKGF